MARLKVFLFGGFRVETDGRRPVAIARRKSRALLAILALRPGHAYARDALTALLWADVPDDQARHSLRQELHELRGALALSKTRALVIDAASVAIDPAHVEVDTATFERLASETTLTALERAAALYEGDLLLGLSVREDAFEEWLGAERERLRQRAIGVFTRLLEQQTAKTRSEAAIDTALRLFALDPTQETVHRSLMRLYASQGRRAAALRQYQLCVDVLQRELGVEPENATRALYQELLAAPQTAAPPLGARRHAERRSPRPTAERARVEGLLIGRETEAVRLRAMLDDAVARRGRVVAILGEAGLGKTRLVSHVTALAVEAEARVVVGRAYETAQVLAFGPWIDLLRAAIAVDPAIIDELDPVWRAELGRLVPEIDPRAPRRAPPDVTRLFEAVNRCLERLAAAAPLVVVLEDVHWADDLTLRLAAFVARRLERTAILLVLTAREEQLSDAAMLRVTLDELRDEPWGEVLTLRPLSRTDTATLTRSLSRAEHDETALTRLGDDVWRVSAGNPLLVLETVRALHQRSPDDAAAGWLPTRIRELVMARLERLSERARRAVSIASVIGREFDFRLLQHCAALDDRHGAEVVEELVRRRVFNGVGERLDFSHDLVREVVREALPHEAAKSLHRLIGASIEAVYAADLAAHYDALAAHYHRGERWDKAVGYLVQAAETAVERSAYRAAAGYFEQALEALSHLPESRATLEQRVDICLALHTSRYAVNDFTRSYDALREAAEPARRLGDPRRSAILALQTAQYLWVSGRSAEALPLADHAWQVGDSTADRALATSSLLYRAAIRFALGDFQEAEQQFRRVVEWLNAAAEHRFGLHGFPLVFAECGLAVICAEQGRFDEAHAHAAAGIRTAEALDHAYTLVFGLRAIGHAYTVEGRIDDALAILDRALARCRDETASALEQNVIASIGYAYALSGRADDGLRLMEQSRTAIETAGNLVWYGLLLTQIAEASLIGGDVARAHQAAARALVLTRERGERWFEARALALLGDIAARRDDRAAANASYRAALKLAEERELRPLVARCRVGLATLSSGAPA
jgi:DNA-binding SARP family transcriptional activator/energy-coupling factor transporter ATP-binding protein EcfA2